MVLFLFFPYSCGGPEVQTLWVLGCRLKAHCGSSIDTLALAMVPGSRLRRFKVPGLNGYLRLEA